MHPLNDASSSSRFVVTMTFTSERLNFVTSRFSPSLSSSVDCRSEETRFTIAAERSLLRWWEKSFRRRSPVERRRFGLIGNRVARLVGNCDFGLKRNKDCVG
ncbi:unnamed protein product [Sphenostylis stenocarpa]|uniref:Uncharacterized protein n=1 Tax=Sphenostylis stenocarpa TaxID=92480 RepID=A0AA86SLG4_9FABA|nr:unnamed protein product [Sphenostylis stenocarpa]